MLQKIQEKGQVQLQQLPEALILYFHQALTSVRPESPSVKKLLPSKRIPVLSSKSTFYFAFHVFTLGHFNLLEFIGIN